MVAVYVCGERESVRVWDNSFETTSTVQVFILHSSQLANGMNKIMHTKSHVTCMTVHKLHVLLEACSTMHSTH